MTEDRAKNEALRNSLAKIISLETVAKRRVGRPWCKGESGNPSGKPRGALSKRTVSVGPMRTLRANTTKLMRKAIEMALLGDSVMLKFLLERVLPRDRLLTLELPRISSVDAALEALGVIMQALGDGTVSPAEAAALSAVAKGYVDIDAISRLKVEVEALQEAMRARGMSR
jgi:hypothetical protein